MIWGLLAFIGLLIIVVVSILAIKYGADHTPDENWGKEQ